MCKFSKVCLDDLEANCMSYAQTRGFKPEKPGEMVARLAWTNYAERVAILNHVALQSNHR